jgi:hypothetical protein
MCVADGTSNTGITYNNTEYDDSYSRSSDLCSLFNRLWLMRMHCTCTASAAIKVSQRDHHEEHRHPKKNREAGDEKGDGCGNR